MSNDEHKVNLLTSYREKINRIDDEIKQLLIERINTVKAVAEYKFANNMEIFQSGREVEILNRITKSDDKNISSALGILYKIMMDTSKLYQHSIINKNNGNTCNIEAVVETGDIYQGSCITDKKAVIGCQGIKGAYSHQAASLLFKDNKILFYENFKDVFTAIENGNIEYGVVPLENSNAGTVKDNFTLLNQYNYYIAAEISIPIKHCLLINKKAAKEGLTTVFSHEQALSQCRNYLEKHENFNGEIYSNTATAAKYVSESNNIHYGAISSAFCAELYDLKVAEENIHDNEFNNTRFVVISKKFHVEKSAKKLSFIIKLQHEPGALYKLLLKFSYYNLNLTKIESQPIPNSNFEFLFFIDLEGNIYNENIITLINSIKSEVEYFKFLGNYNMY